MARTAIIYDKAYLKHDSGRNHPERKERLIAIMSALEERGLLASPEVRLIKPKQAVEEDLLLAHTREYINEIKRFSELGGGPLTVDTAGSKDTFDVALLAVGGALSAADLVMRGEVKNAFAFIRPPGHHASSAMARGFCFFNNIVILGEYLRKNHGLKRILCVDVDVHHGNGTQDLTYDKNYFLYLGLHQDGRTLYPGTGSIHEIGAAKGRGYNINIPFPPGTGDETYLSALKEVLIPLSEQYKPQIILVSWGFDTHIFDHLASLNLTSQGCSRVAEVLLEVADNHSDGRLIALLEGGYNLDALSRGAVNVVSKMAGINNQIQDNTVEEPSSVREYMKKVLEQLKQNLKDFWTF